MDSYGRALAAQAALDIVRAQLAEMEETAARQLLSAEMADAEIRETRLRLEGARALATGLARWANAPAVERATQEFIERKTTGEA